jgi:hypothetical protein
MGLKLIGTHQLLPYADDVNLLGDDITLWPEYVSELYRPSNRSLSAKCQLLRSDGSQWPCSQIYRPELLLFLPSSFSVVLMRLSGPCSKPTTSQRMW